MKQNAWSEENVQRAKSLAQSFGVPSESLEKVTNLICNRTACVYLLADLDAYSQKIRRHKDKVRDELLKEIVFFEIELAQFGIV